MIKKVDYFSELYGEILENMLDYHQTGYTVCGAQDPAVIYLDENFGVIHPSLAEYKVVRVKETYLNSWNSATYFEFSNQDITDEEYEQYEEVMKEEES